MTETPSNVKRYTACFVLIFSCITVVPLLIIFVNYIGGINADESLLSKLFKAME